MRRRSAHNSRVALPLEDYDQVQKLPRGTIRDLRLRRHANGSALVKVTFRPTVFSLRGSNLLTNLFGN
jgi:hypothetical protein